jgi:heme/copper-type cytochrome/quinol oxidase subunit 1
MALTETRPEIDEGTTPGAERPAATSLERLVGTGDHLSNGRVLIGFALFFLALSATGLTLAALDATTTDGLLGGIAEPLLTSSLVGLALLGVMPLLVGLGFYLVPLQVGSPSIAFPRAASLSLWGWLVGAALFVLSVVLDGGIGGSSDDAARIGSLSLGLVMVSLALGMVCIATTVLSHRPLGMGLARVPFFSWSMLVAAPIWIMTLGSAVAHIFVGHVVDADAAGLAANFEGGIAWMLRAPSVYALAIPVLGIAADHVGHTTGRRLAPYGLFQGAIAAFGIFSFGVWTQNEVAGQTVVWIAFVVLAALPVVAMLGGLGDVLRRGRVPAIAALGALVLAHLLILGAVLAGALQALDTAGSGNLFDLETGALTTAQLLFVVTAAALGGIAGLVHWSPRIFGSGVGEGLARIAALAVLVGGAILATVMLVQSIAAADGRGGLDEAALYGISAAGAALLTLGVVASLVAVLGAARSSYDGEADEGTAAGGTLEWSAAGVPVAGAELETPSIRSPYPLFDLRDGTEAEGSN